MKQYNLTWGESVAVRQAFLEQTRGIPIQFGLEQLHEMDYTPFNGDAKLILETHRVIKRQTGKEYKHIFLTNGASGGCTIALRAHAYLGYDTVATNPAPWFPLYPMMAEACDLRHIWSEDRINKWTNNTVFLLDTPTNPTGMHTSPFFGAGGCSLVWDAVYHNNVYVSVAAPPPANAHTMVGSYSKLTGLNGLRLGWIATNDDLLADAIGKLIAPEYCGLSKPSKMILTTLLDQFNNDPDYYWGAFELAARYRLDLNREIWSELERFFGGTPVSSNGMFYYAPMDKACKELFEKAGVLWQAGSKCGTNDDFGRFNIGQDCKLIQSAMRAVLKADKI